VGLKLIANSWDTWNSKRKRTTIRVAGEKKTIKNTTKTEIM